MVYKFLVKALCNGGFGIHPISMYVDYDDRQPVEKFFEDCRSAMFMAGYTSILHWKSIDDCEYAKIIFDMEACEPFARKVLELLAKRQWFIKRIDWIEQAKNGKKIEDVFCNGKGEWMAKGGWSEDSLKREKRSIESTISSYKECLSLLGVDVDDRERMKNILTNLGFYKVDMYGNNKI